MGWEVGLNEGPYLRGAGLQQPGQAGEDADEEQGLLAVKLLLLAAK